VLSRGLAPAVTRRIAPKPLMMYSVAATGIGLMLMPLFSHAVTLALISFAAGLVLGVGAPLAGWLADRFGHARMMVVFFLGLGLASIIAGFVSDSAEMGLALALHAMGRFGEAFARAERVASLLPEVSLPDHTPTEAEGKRILASSLPSSPTEGTGMTDKTIKVKRPKTPHGIRYFKVGAGFNLEDLRAEIDARGLEGLLLLDTFNVIYASGFFHSANERPVGFYLPVRGPKEDAQLDEAKTLAALKLVFEDPSIGKVGHSSRPLKTALMLIS
jgi:hypothetical protein